MTDAGYVAGGYGVTIVAIGAYVGYMWARNRTVVRLAHPPSRSGHVSAGYGPQKRDQNDDGSPPGSGDRLP